MGRLIAVDIVIPLNNGQGFLHRILAIYAPWDIDDTNETTSFWNKVTKLCQSTPHSWTLLGNLNATVSSSERKSRGSVARTHFNKFLHQAKGTDLWTKYPEQSRFVDWTCRNCLTTDGGSIIDCIVSSTDGFSDSEILIADDHHDYIPMTDHRPIVGCLILKPPNRILACSLHNVPTPILNNPHIKFPSSKNKHLFQIFCDKTDHKIKTSHLQDH